jgi:putative spermidine/putrescine transport system substrate-binding protein
MTIRTTIGRRTLIKGAGAGAAAVAFPTVLTPRRSAASVKIVARDPGGPFEKAFGEGLYKRFNEKFRGQCEVVGVPAAHEPVALVKGMVDNKAYQWNVALLSLAAHNALGEKYLEQLNLKGSAYDEIKPEYKRPTFSGNDVYNAIIAYRTDKVKKPPKSWADYWNAKDFPGRRALRNHPFDTIEEALMADGVPNDKVYPCDFDRAFKSLDKIKKDIALWWTSGAQTTQILKTGEVDMTTTWNGRAQAAIDDGAPVAIEWNQSIAGVEGWCILKGSPNYEWSQKFIAFAAEATSQAAWTPFLSYGPTNPNAYKHIDAKRARDLGTFPEHVAKSILIDNDFWAANMEKGLNMMKEWFLKA